MSNLNDIVDAHSDRLIDKKNVVGVAVGNKYVDGKDTGEQAILVFVEQKEAQEKLAPKDMIEKQINGVRTDVVGRSGTFKKLAYTGAYRPIEPGVSCGHMLVTAGTIGAFFTDRDGDLVALSNNHVLANEAPFYAATVYDPATGRGHIAIQPGIYDSGNLTHKFGQLKKYCPLARYNNTQDSAIAICQPNGWGTDSKWYRGPIEFNPAIKNIGELVGWNDDPSINMDVQKTGRTTGYTTGKVIGVHATISVGYDNGVMQFKDQIVTTDMSLGGDSGSILVDMNRNAVGLLFAGSSQFTLHNPIKYPREFYGLSIFNSTPIVETSTLNVITTDGTSNVEFSLDNLRLAMENAQKAARDGQNVTIEVTYNARPQ